MKPIPMPRPFHPGPLLAVLIACSIPASAGVPEQLPAPDGESADMSQPVRVYILMGQSNMIGFGQTGPDDSPGSLGYLTKTEKKYPHLIDGDGDWTVRRDVWCIQAMPGNRRGWLQPGFGARADMIGPELGFGHVMGHIHDGPVVLIKAAWGNRALGWDLMPPSSRTIPPEEHENQYYQGYQLDAFLKATNGILDDLEGYFPDYAGQGHEIAGFAWWQGHADQRTPRHVAEDPRWEIDYTADYETNLANLIQDLRTEFDAPEAPFVLATIAFNGERLSGGGLKVARAQLAVSDPEKHPDFAGNVKTVEARPFWRDADISPANAGHHYHHNAATYHDVGEALGRAMAQLHAGE